MPMNRATDTGSLTQKLASRTYYVTGSSIVRKAFSHELSCRSDVEAGCDDGDPWNYYAAPGTVHAAGHWLTSAAAERNGFRSRV